MKTSTSWKRLVTVLALGVALTSVSAFSTVSEVMAVGANGSSLQRPGLSRPTGAGLALTLAAAPA